MQNNLEQKIIILNSSAFLKQLFNFAVENDARKLSKRSASLRSIWLALIFMLKMFCFQIFSLPILL